jgi:lipid-binding SYLF domain-containing protein
LEAREWSFECRNKKDSKMKTAQSAIYPPSVVKTSLFIVVAVMLNFAAQSVWAKTAQEIEASVYACLDRFYNQIKSGREMIAMATWVLVMPGVVKAGLIVGGEYGEGALRE